MNSSKGNSTECLKLRFSRQALAIFTLGVYAYNELNARKKHASKQSQRQKP